MNESIFFYSVWPQGKAFLGTFLLLHIQNVVDWALLEIKQFCFLFQKAEMHSFTVKLILDILDEY